MIDPVVVIGGGLAGLAAAARLAKNGHPVELFERSPALGGLWAATEFRPGVLVDQAPAVLGFPAPWRDLFRKSGRPLEAELSRMGYALEPAGPPDYHFADRSELRLPTDRGEAFEVVAAAYGSGVATRWRELIDSLGDVWQALRPLGLEADFHPRDRFGRSAQLTRAVRRRLLSRRSLADFAASAPHPHLTALVRSVGYRLGSTPEQLPAMVAVDLWNWRTFGRWQIVPALDPTGHDAGRSSVLVEALEARLALRRVTVHEGVSVESITVEAERATGVRTSGGDHPAAAVISTVDPWSTSALLPAAALRRTRRDLQRLLPAQAPTIEHRLIDQPAGPVGEQVDLSAEGRPVVSYTRPVADHTLCTVHDFDRTQPSAAYGLVGPGFSGWTQRPPISSEVAGLFLAGPWSAAGPGPAQQVLSGALAAYACHELLSPHT
jgi:UDP-galactopyranose mutase